MFPGTGFVPNVPSHRFKLSSTSYATRVFSTFSPVVSLNWAQLSLICFWVVDHISFLRHSGFFAHHKLAPIPFYSHREWDSPQCSVPQTAAVSLFRWCFSATENRTCLCAGALFQTPGPPSAAVWFLYLSSSTAIPCRACSAHLRLLPPLTGTPWDKIVFATMSRSSKQPHSADYIGTRAGMGFTSSRHHCRCKAASSDAPFYDDDKRWLPVFSLEIYPVWFVADAFSTEGCFFF